DGKLKRRTEFWIRFLFSALVDADRLDTGEFRDPHSASLRARFASVSELRGKLDSYIDGKVAHIPLEIRNSPVNAMRARVLKACRQTSPQSPGMFTLTVPTGGGKTLSAMSFALRHAEHNNLRRVIVVIPYTSIIEQNAKEYRNALGLQNVIEHHSDIDLVEFKKVHGEETATRLELACENWDAPVIVTTTVQFFESLFSNRPSRCRKLHHIARSVIVLDEVQTLPPGFLLSILDALNELVAYYGCSVVLSTATPPALALREGFECGLRDIIPIVWDDEDVKSRLERVECVWPKLEEPPLDWSELAKQLANRPQVLAVVHKRNDARVLAQHLQKIVPTESVFHLSALMCPSHRLYVLDKVKDVLRRGAACRLVSTQLVEAGVDIDFPVVYRALGGLDSIVQVAGRCNREGKLVGKGQVVVFRARTSPPMGTPKRGMEIAESLLRENGGKLDINDGLLMETYFRALYFAENMDVHSIQAHRQEFDFGTVGSEFKLIEDGFTRYVVVPYGQASERIDKLSREGTSRDNLRALQPFTVSIYPDAFGKLVDARALDEIYPDIFRLASGYDHLYDDKFGLIVGDEPVANPRAFVI
ncbi:MAG: DEAD/DEAH box helicase, partial [bacterium]